MIAKIERSDIPLPRSSVKSHIMNDITGFIDSGWECAEISAEGYKDIHSAYSSYNNACKSHGLRHIVKVELRGDRAFLLRVGK